MGEISLDLAENLPGKETERKSPRGELYWIFTAITDTIAWSILPPRVFQKMFRQDLLVASLFRNFLLAKRLMKGMRCNPQSNPPLPDCSSHPLWQVWDFALESGLLHTAAELKGTIRMEPHIAPWYVDVGVVAGGSGSSAYIESASSSFGTGNSNPPVSLSAPFFADMLTAFEIWLEFGGGSKPYDVDGGGDCDDFLGQISHFPVHLPIILQVICGTITLCRLFLYHNFIISIYLFAFSDITITNVPSSCTELVVEIFIQGCLGRELCSVGRNIPLHYQASPCRKR